MTWVEDWLSALLFFCFVGCAALVAGFIVAGAVAALRWLFRGIGTMRVRRIR